MKLLSVEQIRELDAFTITNEPVSSIDLMERAARACTNRIIRLVAPENSIAVICGKGNNGGDGLAIARMLLERGYNCSVYIIHYSENFSKDAQINFERLQDLYPNHLFSIHNISELNTKLDKTHVVIDAIFGTGITKELEGLSAQCVNYMNTCGAKIISVDVPSGLFCDKVTPSDAAAIHSHLTLSFQLPKLAFLLSQNKTFVPEFELLDIGLSESGLHETKVQNYYVTSHDIRSLLKPRSKFSHKGNFGHALLIAGSKGKGGAALLAAKACLRSGAGLLTVHSTKNTNESLLRFLPESMSVNDSHAEHISEIEHLEKYDAIAFGPGVGVHEDTGTVLKKILNYYTGKLVIDADGLNCLAENKTWLDYLQADTILTPHPKEFERLTKKYENDFDQLNGAKQFSVKYNCILVLKGAHTIVAMPDGNTFYNSSGNAGLAKGGSGDVLTGILLGLLSRGYSAPQAALIGTFIHGYAADLCVAKKSKESLLISDVIDKLPRAFKKLENKII